MDLENEFDLEYEVYEIINSEVFAQEDGCCGEEAFHVIGMGEAARLISGFIEENYEPKIK